MEPAILKKENLREIGHIEGITILRMNFVPGPRENMFCLIL